MEIEFSYIKNRLREYKKQDLIEYSYQLLNSNNNEFKPIWFVFLLMKWTYLYGGEKYPSKELTAVKFHYVLNCITNFNKDHIPNFLKSGKIDRGMSIFFLNNSIYKK